MTKNITADIKKYRKEYYQKRRDEMIERAKKFYIEKKKKKIGYDKDEEEQQIKREKEIKQCIDENFTCEKENEEPFFVPISDIKEELIIELDLSSAEIVGKYKTIKIVIRK